MTDEGKISIQNVDQAREHTRVSNNEIMARNAISLIKTSPEKLGKPPVTLGDMMEKVSILKNHLDGKQQIESALSSLSQISIASANREDDMRDDPTNLLKEIGRFADKFAKDEPDEFHDGTWHDVVKVVKVIEDNPHDFSGIPSLYNIAHVLREETLHVYMEKNDGKYPQTEEERQRIQEAMDDAKDVTIT